MDSCGRQEGTKTRSRNRKPPLGSWQPTVPSWEKKFCAVVGSVPWGKLLDTKKCLHLYDNVVKWNDSAGEEAFHNAKNRFWAEWNGLPCDISLPDPDIYIDKIDWNSNVDPELLLDLEREFVVPDDGEKGEQVVIFGDSLVPNHVFCSTGWGDAEDDLKQANLETTGNQWESNPAQGTGWGDVCNDSWCRNESNGAVKDNGWEYGWNESNPAQGTGWGDVCNDSWRRNESNGTVKDNGWEDGWNENNPAQGTGWGDVCNDSWCRNESNRAVKDNGWEDHWNNYRSDNLRERDTTRVWEPWDGHYWNRESHYWNRENRENSGRYMSRYKTSRHRGNESRYKTLRHRGDDHLTSREWRNGNGRRRGNFVY